MIKLKGLTWDHPRGYDSIVAVTKIFEQSFSNIQLTWHKRSLKEFGDQPLEEFINEYDLLMIDYPFVGDAHENGFLSRLEQVLPEDYLVQQSEMHVGKSYESYTYLNYQYALPIDASAQFSAFNIKNISHNDIPRTWDQFMERMNQTSFSKKVIWPLCTTDLWCSFLTISAQFAANRTQVFNDLGIEETNAQKAIDFLKTASENIPKESWKLNPIQALELMIKEKYSFAPLLFGYISYSKKESNIRFLNAIAPNPERPISLLGGVGLAISAYSSHQQECADFVKFVLNDKIISESYFKSSGQPSLKSSWNSATLNKQSGNFFTNTIESMNHAYVRPRVLGFNMFQEAAAHYLHENLKKVKEKQLINKLNKLYNIHCL